MGQFFSLDGAFYKYGSMLADAMIIGLMWFFFSIPIFTMGASTTALFYVMTRKQSERDGYITKDFWISFKKNFKQATIVWLVIIVLGLILFFNISTSPLLGDMAAFFLPVQYILAFELFIINIYIFAILSRFELPLKMLIKNAFFMANRHLLSTFVLMFLLAACILGVLYMPPLVMIIAGAYGFLASSFFMKIFRKYRPEMDRDIFDDDGYYMRAMTSDDIVPQEPKPTFFQKIFGKKENKNNK